jgi:hypothetical protein
MPDDCCCATIGVQKMLAMIEELLRIEPPMSFSVVADAFDQRSLCRPFLRRWYG